MNHIIIAHLYNPGSAATNRILAFAKGYAQLDLAVSLVLGCENEELLPELSGVEVSKVTSKTHVGLFRKMAKTIKQLYVHGRSVIQIYGSPVLCLYLPQTKYNIFFECTEVPFYGKKKTLKNWSKETIKRWLTKRATGVIVISKALWHYFKNEGVKNIEIVNMFVDAERFDKALDNPKEKYVAYCGKISLFKDGVDCLIRAFQFFYRQHQDYRLWIIGGFENEETEKQLKQMVQSLQIEDAVKFVGQVRPEDMPSMLKSAQMLALARPDNEQAKYGFPTKLGEYLATGKPVVVTRVGEIGDFLTDGINCRMANPDDPKDFTEKMDWVANHYEEAKELGKEGKHLTYNVFSSLEQCKEALAFMNRTSKS